MYLIPKPNLNTLLLSLIRVCTSYDDRGLSRRSLCTGAAKRVMDAAAPQNQDVGKNAFGPLMSRKRKKGREEDIACQLV